MKNQLKSIAMTASSIISLLAITAASMPITAAAAKPDASPATLASATNTKSGRGTSAVDRPAAVCKTMEAAEVYWVTLTEDGEIDEKVDSYPEETTKVTAAFDYNCVPKKTKITTVWSIDGEQVLTSDETPKPTEKANTWTESIFMKDESALPNGEYGIEFYIGEDLLASGTVVVGQSKDTPEPTPEPSAEVTVQGTVVDSRTKKPINGALVVVLNEGVDGKQWLQDGKDEDVFAFAKTDSKGQFELNNKIPVNVEHPWIIGAKGYRLIYQADFKIDEGAEDPYVLNVALERQK
jgi:hypothetical protein